MASNKKPVLDPTIAPRLRQLCGERSLSFSELARRTGISRATLTRILKGQRSAQPAELRQILKTLRVRRRDFIAPPESPETQLPPQPQLMLPPPGLQPVEIQELEPQLHRALAPRPARNIARTRWRTRRRSGRDVPSPRITLPTRRPMSRSARNCL